MGNLVTIFAFAFVIFFHELGHFLAAKRVGVYVYEFAIGFGTKLTSVVKNGTEFSLRLLPFGGFVKLAGMEEAPENAPEIQEEQKYSSKSVSQRCLIIVAGSLMNIILGFILYLFLNLFVGIATDKPIIHNVLENSPAQQAGLMKHDEILRINEQPVKSVKQDIIDIIKASANQDLLFEIKRNNEIKRVLITPNTATSKTPQIGVSFQLDYQQYNIFKSVAKAVDQTWFSIKQVFVTFSMLFSNQVGVQDLAGPVGIFQMASIQLKQNAASFFSLMAFISISLGVINLFPLPVLDGGHLFFLIWEAVFKKPIPKKIEIGLSYLSIAVLVSLTIFILFNDIYNWGSRAELIKGILSK